MEYPDKINHWLENREMPPGSGEYLGKINPATGRVLTQVASGGKDDVGRAVTASVKAFPSWKNTSVIKRSDILRRAAFLMEEKISEIARIIHLETGKTVRDALAESAGAVELGYFYAGEGRRFFGRTTESAMPDRSAMTIREPVGVAALIVPFNTPVANVAWKSFPALLCGNTVVLKASSDAPYTALWFAKILKEAGLPPGVFNIIQGMGSDAGKALVEDERIALISFTGSSQTGRLIARKTAGRFVKTSLEMGGKNPFVVCDDADLNKAAEFAVSSAFSNAGQRCASASRVIVFAKVYDQFKKIFLEKTEKLKVGSSDNDDVGPIINAVQLDNILQKVAEAVAAGAKLLAGGKRLAEDEHKSGFYMAPTVLEGVKAGSPLYDFELFGPVTALFKAGDFKEAISLANNSSYGLTSAIHTRSLARAREFIRQIEAGVVSVNGPSHGSEPHMPFGGIKASGNGHREPGPEALDFYSNTKSVYIKHDPQNA